MAARPITTGFDNTSLSHYSLVGQKPDIGLAKKMKVLAELHFFPEALADDPFPCSSE